MNISTLQAMAGRFLTSTDLFASDAAVHRRLVDLVRAFQSKLIDPAGLHAALSSERTGGTLPSSSGAVAVIPLTGVLMPSPSIFSFLGFGTVTPEFSRSVIAASLDPSVKSIVIAVDSPGGSIRQIPEAAAALRQARTRKPVVASVTGLAASAAYWIISNAHSIEATPSASVGAIGVLAERVSLARKLEHDGVDVTVISAGKFKHEGHPALPLDAPERQALQQRVDDAYGGFVNDIVQGRHVSAKVVRETYGEGRLVDAKEAMASGMIDKVASVEDTIVRALRTPGAIAESLTHRISAWQSRTARLKSEAVRAEMNAHRARLQAITARAALR